MNVQEPAERHIGVFLFGPDGVETKKAVKAEDQWRFVFDGLMPGRYLLLARQHGHERVDRRQVVLSAESGPLIVRLRPAARILGVVVGPDGSPLAGARVVGRLLEPRSGVRHAVTDSTGRFTLTDIYGGPYQLSASRGGAQTTASVNVPRTGDFEVRIVLE